ncbi:MAG: hypothetical protein HW421_268 [Ignavibacteria bacterium]|nr:hypothetical protein [Ignavibacteria bacterium]
MKDLILKNNRNKVNILTGFVLLIFIILLQLLPCSLLSQVSGGGYSEAFMHRNVGGRPIAMAGAYTAISNEPNGIFYNPAALGFFSDVPQVSTMYSLLDYGRYHNSIAWAQSVTGNIGLGFGINSFYGGAFTARDQTGLKRGDYSSISNSLVGALSYSIDFASIGFGFKYISENLLGSQTYAHGYGLDAGMKFNVLDLFSFGVAIQNLSSRIFWNTTGDVGEDLPYTIRTGVAAEYNLNVGVTRSNEYGELEYIPPTRYILVSLDAVMTQRERAPRLMIGAEAALHEVIIFRAGMGLYGEDNNTPQILPMNLWGAGVSIRPKISGAPFKLHIDYSISEDNLSKLKIAHHFALMFEF